MAVPGCVVEQIAGHRAGAHLRRPYSAMRECEPAGNEVVRFVGDERVRIGGAIQNPATTGDRGHLRPVTKMGVGIRRGRTRIHLQRAIHTVDAVPNKLDVVK